MQPAVGQDPSQVPVYVQAPLYQQPPPGFQGAMLQPMGTLINKYFASLPDLINMGIAQILSIFVLATSFLGLQNFPCYHFLI
jgi:hypothetical protein